MRARDALRRAIAQRELKSALSIVEQALLIVAPILQAKEKKS